MWLTPRLAMARDELIQCIGACQEAALFVGSHKLGSLTSAPCRSQPDNSHSPASLMNTIRVFTVPSLRHLVACPPLSLAPCPGGRVRPELRGQPWWPRPSIIHVSRRLNRFTGRLRKTVKPPRAADARYPHRRDADNTLPCQPQHSRAARQSVATRMSRTGKRTRAGLRPLHDAFPNPSRLPCAQQLTCYLACTRAQDGVLPSWPCCWPCRTARPPARPQQVRAPQSPNKGLQIEPRLNPGGGVW